MQIGGLTCKHCGSQAFKTSTEPQTDTDFVGSVCVNCGAEVMEDDIVPQAADALDKLLGPKVTKRFNLGGKR